jgi:hypothetical protein
MSHRPERKEKNCLNCGTTVQGKYCQVCGQENVEPKETFWGMVVHFFNDITHFDGKFFTTMNWLLRKPGFLSSEYIKGRRASYLHPIRMYVFTSALFFIIFFSLFNAEVDVGAETGKLENVLDDFSTEAYKNAKTKEDSINIYKALALVKLSGKTKTDKSGNGAKLDLSLGNAAEKYESIAAYDSAQQLLHPVERDNWLVRQINRKGIHWKQKYSNNWQQLVRDLLDKFIHSFPYLLFVSLPLYALILKFLYFRRKQFYYADHGIFLIHLYIFTFLLLLIYFLVDKLKELVHLGVWNFLQTVLLLFGIFYAYKAMRKFYGQGRGKTLFKFIFFNIICGIAVIILFALFLIFSAYQV